MEGSGVTIPQDIMATARTVADKEVNFGSYEVNTLATARAILAARQRCADVAIQYFRGYEYNGVRQAQRFTRPSSQKKTMSNLETAIAVVAAADTPPEFHA